MHSKKTNKHLVVKNTDRINQDKCTTTCIDELNIIGLIVVIFMSFDSSRYSIPVYVLSQ